MKTCTQCGELKSLTLFGRKSSRKDGRRSDCKECQKVSAALYREANRERLNEESRIRTRSDPRVKAHKKKWRQKNPDKCYEFVKQFRDRNPTYATSRAAVRRARTKVATVDGSISYQAIYEAHDYMCHICGTKIDKDLAHPHPFSKSIDHKIPLVKGGLHVEENLAPAHMRCNILKGGT